VTGLSRTKFLAAPLPTSTMLVAVQYFEQRFQSVVRDRNGLSNFSNCLSE